MGDVVTNINIDDIIPNRFQPREFFHEGALNELAKSIKNFGVIEPIIVRPVNNKYEIIAGERRCKASSLAGLNEIPAIIRNLDDKEAAKQAVLENIQRQDLSPIEESRTYQTILNLENFTQSELAESLGKTQSYISNKLRLLTLPEEVQEALLTMKISERHARSLLQIDDPKLQVELLNYVVENKIPVRILNNKIKELREGVDMNNENTVFKPVNIVENGGLNVSPVGDTPVVPVPEGNSNVISPINMEENPAIVKDKEDDNIVQNISGEEVIGEGKLAGEEVGGPVPIAKIEPEQMAVEVPRKEITEVDNRNKVEMPTNHEDVEVIDAAVPKESGIILNQTGGEVLPTNTMPGEEASTIGSEPSQAIKDLIVSQDLKMALIGINNIVRNLERRGVTVKEIHRTYADKLELILELRK